MNVISKQAVEAERVEFEDAYYLRMVVPRPDGTLSHKWFLPHADHATYSFVFNWVGTIKQRELEAIYNVHKTLDDIRKRNPVKPE